jgi:hypothetical protein
VKTGQERVFAGIFQLGAWFQLAGAATSDQGGGLLRSKTVETSFPRRVKGGKMIAGNDSCLIRI